MHPIIIVSSQPDAKIRKSKAILVRQNLSITLSRPKDQSFIGTDTDF